MKFKVILILIIVLISIGVRVIYLNADPPSIVPSISGSGSLYCDEGMYPHNARNKIIFSKWVTDDWNPFIYNPILTIIYYIAFLIFGVKILVVKFINILIGLAIILLFFKIASEMIKIHFAFLVSIAFSLNFYLIVYNRAGLLENFSTMCFMLVFLFFLKSKKNYKLSFWTGFIAVLAIISKYLFLFFYMGVLFSIILLSFKKKNIKYFTSYILGSFTTLILWLSIIFLPNIHYFKKIGKAWGIQSIPIDINKGLHNLLNNALPRFFAISPIILVLSVLFISFVLTKFIFKKKINTDEFFVFLWIVLTVLQIGILNYQPLRYYLPIISAFFIALIFFIKNIEEGIIDKKLFSYSVFFSSLVFYLFFKNFFIYLFKNPSAFFTYPIGLRMFFIIALVLSLIAGFLKNRPQKIILFFIIFAIFSGEIFLYQKFILHPNYNLKRISNYVSTMKSDSFISGQCALRVCFDTKIKAIPAYKGWFNDKNLFKRFPITHLLVLKKFNEISWIKKEYLNTIRKFKLKKRFPIWDTQLILFKLSKKENMQ